MRAMPPFPTIEGDSEDRIMARSGELVGWSNKAAVWRFGFISDSPAAKAYGVNVSNKGFIWVLATLRLGRTQDTFVGFAIELPPNFRNVIDWYPDAAD